MARARLWARTVGVAAIVVMTLTACGFEPLYGDRGTSPGAVSRLAAVEVAPIEARIGQVLRNDLLDLISPFGAPAQPTHRLEVRLDFDREGLGFRPDEAITRVSLRLGASYRLVDPDSGETVFSDVARSAVSYNVVQSDFANLNAERDAERRAAHMIGEEISARIALFLTSRAEARGD